MGVVIAIDAGTTGVRAFAVGEDGDPQGMAYREFPQYFPQPGWVEHDADEIWAAVQATVHELLDRLQHRPSQRSASPTNAKPWWHGTATPANPCIGPSCGRTGALQSAASS